MPEEKDDVLLLDQELEDRFFRALIAYDDLHKLIRGTISPEHFSSTVKNRLFKTLMYHWDQFGKTPTIDILIIEASELFKGASTALIERYLDKIEDIPVPDWDWIVQRIDRWVKRIRLHKAIFEVEDQLRRDEVETAEDNLVRAIRSSGIIRSGTVNDLELDEDEIYDIVNDENRFCCTTRIRALDKLIQGLFRRELLLIVSPLNVGKTWSAISMGNAGVMNGKFVLHITAEMGRQLVLQRYFMAFTGMVKPKDQTETWRDVPVWNEEWTAKEMERVKSLLHIRDVKDQIENVRALGGRLSVRAYPSGTLKPSDIDHEVTLFDVKFKRPPDLIIVDALTDMDVRGRAQDRRIRFTDNVTEFIQIIHECNAAGVMTHQANREGLNADVVDASHTSEALAVMQKADTGISLSQTKREHELGKMRLYVMRARNQTKWGMVEAYQNLEIGQFCQVSRIMTSEELRAIETGADLEEQQVPDGQSIDDRMQRRKRHRRTRNG